VRWLAHQLHHGFVGERDEWLLIASTPVSPDLMIRRALAADAFDSRGRMALVWRYGIWSSL
jgi:hypothetical protein